MRETRFQFDHEDDFLFKFFRLPYFDGHNDGLRVFLLKWVIGGALFPVLTLLMIGSFNRNRLRRKSATVPRTSQLGNSSTSGVANGYPILRLPGSSDPQRTGYETHFMSRFKNGPGSGSWSVYVPNHGPGTRHMTL